MRKIGLAGGNAAGWEREWCEDAATDLSRGLKELPTLPDGYRYLLARALFLSEKFYDAAQVYEQLLQSTEKDNQRHQLYDSICLSYELSEGVSNLKVWLDKFLQEFPAEPEVHLKLAELEWQDCNYEAAIAHLRREAELHPGEDLDWRASALLAQGESAESWNAAKTALASVPDWGSLIEILRFHWAAFDRMSQTARDEWIAGAWISSFGPTEDRRKPTMVRKATLAYLRLCGAPHKRRYVAMSVMLSSFMITSLNDISRF